MTTETSNVINQHTSAFLYQITKFEGFTKKARKIRFNFNILNLRFYRFNFIADLIVIPICLKNFIILL